jgi:hypothetical protein
MTSGEAMKAACEQVGVKEVATTLGVSPTWIYNQVNDPEKKDLFQRFVEFSEACGNDIPLQWVCEQFNGYFVKNPEIRVKNEKIDEKIVSGAVKEFGDVLQEVGKAMHDGSVSKSEASKIRSEWEDLKRLLESFVLACEFGYVK